MKKIIAVLSVVLVLSACGQAKNEMNLSWSESQSWIVSQTGSSGEKDIQIINTSASGSTGRSENTKNTVASWSVVNPSTTGTGDSTQIVNDAIKDIENLFGDVNKNVK